MCHITSSAKLVCICMGEKKSLAIPVYFILVDTPSKMYTNMATSVISPAHASLLQGVYSTIVN